MSIAVSNGVDSCIFQNVPGPSFRAAASSSSCWALWRLGNEREAICWRRILYNQRTTARLNKAKFVQTTDLLPPSHFDSQKTIDN
jgi:hypothetical protein